MRFLLTLIPYLCITTGLVIRDAPSYVKIKGVSLLGSGCPAGSADVQVDATGSLFEATFSEYEVETGPGTRPVDWRKNCKLTLNMEFESGFQFTIVETDMIGFAEIPAGVDGQCTNTFSFTVLVFAYEAGIADDIEVVHEETSPLVRNAEVYAANPLGKVPVLLRPGEVPLFDSDVICAYLDTRHGRPPLIPAEDESRWKTLRMQAIAQGLADVGISLRWETTRRPEDLRFAEMREALERKLVEGYDWLERELDLNTSTGTSVVHVGHIAVATTLSWLEFRGMPDFREGRETLAMWFDEFQKRPSMRATPLSGETQDQLVDAVMR
ncbi:glutathione S-transferase [Purpureocillium lilacinum]|uniref:Glutathione S-transferase n=1 Tax=Purpureocillium lilacinum TaxID=33203 RepID=A0A179HWQ8_PURLI|nr:glutathione S-transferase [Purpureocillium lilacinum]OAQ93991.1 glutathione S-transferase [Purpureocillium lilacinum]